MRNLIFFALIIFSSCKSLTDQEKIHQIVTGDWLVLGAEHDLRNADQETIYGHMQDSIMSTKGLKIITFTDDGEMFQIDNASQKGKWSVSTGNELLIANGGIGFNEFKGKYLDYKDEKLRLIEFIHAGGESIKLTWHFKKIDEKNLTSASHNEWRKKATKPETEKEIRDRLSTILSYYADYYALVAKESIYFIGARVILPFTYYQHAIGVVKFDPQSDFAKLFYNEEQAKQAYDYLKVLAGDLGHKYPQKENFVEEYSEYMKLLSQQINETV